MTSVAAIFNRKIKHTRLHDEIVTLLQKQILTEAMKPGTRLPPERELAETFRVNRATVREALRRLEHIELVEIRHGDGVYVRDFMESSNVELIRAVVDIDKSSDVLFHVLEARRIVVPEMASLAAQRRSDADVATLEGILADPSLSYVERDIQVHQAIARATGNLLYIILLNFFNRLFKSIIALYFEEEGNRRQSWRFHQRICEAVRDRKPQEARRIMLKALSFAEESTREILAGENKLNDAGRFRLDRNGGAHE